MAAHPVEMVERYTIYLLQQLEGQQRTAELLERVEVPALVLGEQPASISNRLRKEVLERAYQYDDDDLPVIGGPTALVVGIWYHVALVQRAGGWTSYLDGKLECSGPQTTSPGPELFVGQIFSGNFPTSGFLDGIMDEVRVSGVDRSDAWIALQHRSMTDALIAYGPEQAPGAACPP